MVTRSLSLRPNLVYVYEVSIVEQAEEKDENHINETSFRTIIRGYHGTSSGNSAENECILKSEVEWKV